MFPNKFIIEWNGKAVGIDQNSGGYPYKTDDPFSTHWFPTRQAAQDYINKFINSPSYGFHIPYVKIHEIQFRIMESK